jgi:hypothetical protein
MVAGSILPITIYNKRLYFLFGKENSLEESAPGYSDFGGGSEGNETPYETALREGAEELTGFLGDSSQLHKLITSNGGIFKISHNNYHTHLFYLEYDENLTMHYNQNHTFLWDRMNRKALKETKLFEKIKIDWFSLEDMKKQRGKFRHFYREIVDIFLKRKSEISAFANKCHVSKTVHSRSKSHTRKLQRVSTKSKSGG